MLPNLIDYPIVHGKKNIPVADAHEKNYNHYFSKDFEIEEPEDKETYHSQSNTLTHNNLNAFIVDWEIPKKEY